MTIQVESDAGTRDHILRLIAERGPITAAQLAKILYLTAAAVRRHLIALEEDGLISEHAPSGPGVAKRGRPARHYVTTPRAQDQLKTGYSDIATHALAFMRETMGDESIEAFAQQRVAELEARYGAVIAHLPNDPVKRAQGLVKALNEDGYAASLRSVGPRGFALQLCQGNCPVLKVATAFPELCEAETKAFGRLLNVHVQRLSTQSSGNHVCTTHIPLMIQTSRRTPPPGVSASDDVKEGNQ